MRIYKTLFFLVLLVLTACNSNSAPDNVIPPGQMASVIADLHIVDGSIYNIAQTPDSMYKYGMGNYKQVFIKHHVDSMQFGKSFKYYTTNPKVLTEIYGDVIKTLQARYDSVNKNFIKPKPAKAVPPTNAVPAK